MMMSLARPVRTSAPGKVILHGEHSVVYGKIAFSASLNLRTSVSFHPECVSKKPGLLVFKYTDKNLKSDWSLSLSTQKLLSLLQREKDLKFSMLEDKQKAPHFVNKDLVHFITNFLEEYTSDNTKLKPLLVFLYVYLLLFLSHDRLSLIGSVVSVSSEIPLGAGLGSSAAYCVALSSCLLSSISIISCPPATGGQRFYRWPQTDLNIINKWAFLLEALIHGVPSGIDNTVSCFGGCIKYCRDSSITLNILERCRILLVNTLVSKDTKVLVEKVRQRKEEFPDLIQSIMASINEICVQFEKLWFALSQTSERAKRDSLYSKLETLIDVNQNLLNALGVGHPCLDKVCHLSLKYGLHAKLTGSGGGGCAWILLTEESCRQSNARSSE
ncbi:mevalonate kinase-like isoform X2 [Zophobas morio]|uniref:mevalonate kinase-like isoform X2 n=1 Tax=Zophobas morio TaxID=2755281 RepID=UPI0030835AB9